MGLLTVFPMLLKLISILVCKNRISMLLPFKPSTLIDSPISPGLLAPSMFQIHSKLAFIPPAILVFQQTFTMIFVVLKTSSVLAAIFEYVNAISIHFITFPISIIIRAIVPFKQTSARFLPVQELTFIFRSI